MDEVTYEDDGESIYVSLSQSASATAYIVGPDDDGTAGVREPLTPQDAPPSLAAEVQPDEG
jgi:hypothetical protein